MKLPLRIMTVVASVQNGVMVKEMDKALKAEEKSSKKYIKKKPVSMPSEYGPDSSVKGIMAGITKTADNITKILKEGKDSKSL